MKVRLNHTENRDGEVNHQLYIEDKLVETIYSLSETPEDAIIGRDLIDGDDILHYMQLAYEAGKKGENFEVSYTKEEY